MIIISDTSCIINLAQVGELELLPKIFNEIVIPQAVYDEIVLKGNNRAGAHEIKQATWIKIKQHTNKTLYQELRADLDEGEAEAITLAIELKADLLIIDEDKGRRIAESKHLNYTGLLGVLIRAKQKGLLTEVKPVLDNLIQKAKFRISSELYKEVLMLVNEQV